MEMQEIVQLIGSFISAAGLPLIGAFMFYESRKRKKLKKQKRITLLSMLMNGKNYTRKRKKEWASWILK